MTNSIPVDGVKFILSDKDDVGSIRVVAEWLDAAATVVGEMTLTSLGTLTCIIYFQW